MDRFFQTFIIQIIQNKKKNNDYPISKIESFS